MALSKSIIITLFPISVDLLGQSQKEAFMAVEVSMMQVKVHKMVWYKKKIEIPERFVG
jgi:hypothetical protein